MTTFAIDVYVAVPPIAGEQVVQVPHGYDNLIFPKAKFDKDGMAPLDVNDPAFDGGAAFEKKVKQVIGSTNKAFKDAGVRFRVRRIIFIDVTSKTLVKHFKPEDGVLSFSKDKDGKSGLLADFDKATAGTKDAFRLLIADLELDRNDPEKGRAKDGGNVAVVEVGNTFEGRMQGSIVIHELGHNLGLSHAKGADPQERAMADTEPDVGGNKKVEPKLSPAEAETVRKRVAEGLYDDYLFKPPSKSGMIGTPRVGLDEGEEYGQAPQDGAAGNCAEGKFMGGIGGLFGLDVACDDPSRRRDTDRGSEHDRDKD
jgi:hypothetical protein